jgi:hypothetical protein
MLTEFSYKTYVSGSHLRILSRESLINLENFSFTEIVDVPSVFSIRVSPKPIALDIMLIMRLASRT